MPGLAAGPRAGSARRQGTPAGASPAQAPPGHKSGCAVLAVTLVSQGQVRESDNGPSTPQGGLGVHRGLCVKQGVTSTRVPSKVLPCSQNKHAVRGGAGRGCRGGGSAPLHRRASPACPLAWDGDGRRERGMAGGGDGGWAAREMEARRRRGQWEGGDAQVEVGCTGSCGRRPRSGRQALGCAGEPAPRTPGLCR